jgi:putative colanic acid biosynthesis acetyltransferase WcaF
VGAAFIWGADWRERHHAPAAARKVPLEPASWRQCWIGEGVWIHNQGLVTIEDNAVVSQEAFVTTGSHDIYESMDLLVKPVIIRRGAWVTTRCIVLQGVEIGQNAILTPGSVANKSLPPASIYGGNPADFVRKRWENVP